MEKILFLLHFFLNKMQAQFYGINYDSFIAIIPEKGIIKNLKNLKASEKYKTLNVIILPIPEQLRDNIDIGWEGKTAYSLSSEKFSNLKNLLVNGDFDTEKIAGMLGNEIIKNIESMGGTLSSSLEYTMKKAINPHMNLLFSGMNFRSFQLNWNLQPNSEKEAKYFKDVILNLKKLSLPSKSTWIKNISTFDYPAYFTIKIYLNGKERTDLIKIKRCVITNISTDYSSNQSLLLHKDGIPASTSLSITFNEVKWLTKENLMED